MVRNWILKLLLFPLSILYGLFSILYSFFYDYKILAPIRFALPVINVGNLTVGGTGKTPHTEYLINILRPYIKVAALSRGYKRKSNGFLEVMMNSTVKDVGDEPLLYKLKYQELGVFVAESRVEGISQILMKYPNVQTVLLDDAYQHREISPALNLLLTEFDRPFFYDFFLPFGRLREWKSAYKRADAVIVTKCPLNMTKVDKDNFIKELKLKENQRVFFSFYKYYDPYYLYDNQRKLKLTSDKTVVLISALASTSYLINYLEQLGCDYHSLEYNDHHDFTHDEIENLHKIYMSLNSDDKIILTTEKDAMRLNDHRKYLIDNKLPIFVLPVSVDFLFSEKNFFDDYIKNFLLNFKS